MLKGNIGRLRRKKQVEVVDVNEDGTLMIHLKNGYCFREAGVHCFGEDTPMEGLKSVDEVELCTCAECQNGEIAWI